MSLCCQLAPKIYEFLIVNRTGSNADVFTLSTCRIHLLFKVMINLYLPDSICLFCPLCQLPYYRIRFLEELRRRESPKKYSTQLSGLRFRFSAHAKQSQSQIVTNALDEGQVRSNKSLIFVTVKPSQNHVVTIIWNITRNKHSKKKAMFFVTVKQSQSHIVTLVLDITRNKNCNKALFFVTVIQRQSHIVTIVLNITRNKHSKKALFFVL